MKAEKYEKNHKLVTTLANWIDAEFDRAAALQQWRVFKRDFSEWHSSAGQFIGSHDGLRTQFQTVWQLASAKKKREAVLRIDEMKPRYSRLLRCLREDQQEDPAAYGNYESRATACLRMLETLEWLRARVELLKICANPECKTRNTYFFRVYNNDKYCCNACLQQAKELRLDLRHRENPESPKKYKRDQESRDRMSESAQRRWERARAKTGRPQ
jgi:hypothetical protein